MKFYFHQKTIGLDKKQFTITRLYCIYFAFILHLLIIIFFFIDRGSGRGNRNGGQSQVQNQAPSNQRGGSKNGEHVSGSSRGDRGADRGDRGGGRGDRGGGRGDRGDRGGGRGDRGKFFIMSTEFEIFYFISKIVPI